MSRENTTVHRPAIGGMKAPGQGNMTPLQKPEKMWQTVKRLMKYMKNSSVLIALDVIDCYCRYVNAGVQPQDFR